MCIRDQERPVPLNNVYTDLIKIEARQRQRLGALEQWVTVRLQGAAAAKHLDLSKDERKFEQMN